MLLAFIVVLKTVIHYISKEHERAIIEIRKSYESIIKNLSETNKELLKLNMKKKAL